MNENLLILGHMYSTALEMFHWMKSPYAEGCFKRPEKPKFST